MRRRAVLVAALGAVALGCSTGYGPSGFGGGYSELQLNDRTFEIHFRGNGWTQSSDAERGAMRRAAELTTERGFYGFMVFNQGTQVRTSSYTNPVRCSTIGTSTTCNGGDTTTYHKPDSALTIRMVTQFEAAQMGPSGFVYDARMILAQMAQ